MSADLAELGAGLLMQSVLLIASHVWLLFARRGTPEVRVARRWIAGAWGLWSLVSVASVVAFTRSYPGRDDDGMFLVAVAQVFVLVIAILSAPFATMVAATLRLRRERR